MHRLTYTRSSYQSNRGRVSFWARICPSAVVFSHIVSIVFKGSAKAKRGTYDTAAWCWSSLSSLRALEGVGIRIEIEGTEHFTTLKGPCVFVANHMSTLETFVLPVLIAPFKDATFVVKKSLVDYPVFKHIMRARDPITVGRVNPRDDLKAVLEGGTARLKAGRSVIIFPQTTRTAHLDPETFNSIGTKLAKKAGVPVVPIALKTDAWGNGRWLKDFGRIDPSKTVRFAFGKALMVSDRGNEEHKAIVEFITNKLREWGGETISASAF